LAPTQQVLALRAYVPALSHPFIEPLIGTIRRECLEETLFWTALIWRQTCSISSDILMSITRTRGSMDARLKEMVQDSVTRNVRFVCWEWHCRELYQTSVAG